MKVVSLYDFTGNMVAPWARANHECTIVDIQHYGGPIIRDDGVTLVPYDVMSHDVELLCANADIIFAFPPCTDLAVSGAAHFARKGAQARADAMTLVYRARDLASAVGCPYMIENPVSVISTEWRKPDFIFHPWEYGGYLPESHTNAIPLIPARDAYPKKTCLWTGGGFIMPERRPVYCPPGYSPQHLYLGGKSQKTKNIRSATPEGFALAVYKANARA